MLSSMVFLLVFLFLLSFTVQMFVSSSAGGNIIVPDNNISRSHYAWFIMDSDHRYKSIYASRFENKLNAITTTGAQYTYNGTFWSNVSYAGINESLKLENSDLNKTVLISESGNVYAMDPISNLYGLVAEAIQNTSFIAVINRFWVGTMMVHEMLVVKKGAGVNVSSFIKKYELNGIDASCTLWSHTCWYLESSNTVQYFKWNVSLQNITEQKSFNFTEESFVSISVHENEVWLITTDGRRAWRRLGVTLQNPSGIRWMIFSIHLPFPVTSVSVGVIGIHVVMQGGLIARFQGFESPNQVRWSNFFEVDTYDEEIVVALRENGKSIQSGIPDAQPTSFGYAMWLRDKINFEWNYFDGLLASKLKGIAIGESGTYVLRRGKLHDVYKIVGTMLEKKDNLEATSMGIGADGVFYTVNNDTNEGMIQCQRPSTIGVKNITINTTLSSFISISCGMLQCWGINRNGTAALIKLKSTDYCPDPYPATNAVTLLGDGILFDHIDTDKSGYTWGVEKDTGDVYFRFGANKSSLEGLMWTNMPGIRLRDVAAGKDNAYGIDSKGNLAYFELKDGNWTTWSNWTSCDADCLGGHRYKERYCHHPAPMYGGKNCVGGSQEIQTCNEQNCTASCIKALDGNGKLRCCNAPNITGTPSAKDIILSCIPATSNNYQCILNGSSSETGACLPVPAFWSQWTNWTQCIGECPSGSRLRQRICLDPLPLISTGCLGASQEHKSCNISCLVTIERKISVGWEDATKGLICFTHGTSFLLGKTVQYSMLHFSNITLPNDAIIRNASVQFTAKSASAVTLQAKVRAVINHETVSESDFETCTFSNFIYTNANQSYTPGDWIAEEQGTEERIENLESVVQEVITSPNWNISGSIIIALTNMSSSWYRYAYSYDGNSLKAPKLKIVYEKRQINGNYSEWSSWSNCTHDCFTGHSYRNRTCDNPSPKYGGLACNGSDFDQKTCNTHSCYDFSTCTNATSINGSISCCMLGMPLSNGSIYNDCVLAATQEYVCPLDRFGLLFGECVAINGNFSDWSSWSNCSHECFTGYSFRNRTCDNPSSKYGGLPCNGIAEEKTTCNTHACNDTSTCTKARSSNGSITCCMLGMPLDNGTIYTDCISTANQSFICPLDRFRLSFGECVAIDGNFSSWSSWSNCTHDCFTGHRHRNRTCDNPSPKYGGIPCNGSDVEKKLCNTHSCYDPLNCTLAYGSTSVGCCMLDMPLHNQYVYTDCVPVSGNNYGCPMDRFNYTFGMCAKIHGKYSEWSHWSNCSQNCAKTRSRVCNSPSPKYGGNPCNGDSTDQATCSNSTCFSSIDCIHAMDAFGNYRCCIGNCIFIQLYGYSGYQCSVGSSFEVGICLPVNGNWTAWSQWSECDNTTSCVKQVRHRYRECSNPTPLYFGTQCQGSNNEAQSCANCTALEFSDWSAWTVCSKTCGNGTKTRFRECLNSLSCNGTTNMSSVCINTPCEEFSDWSEWTVCSKTCGNGTKIRFRACLNFLSCDGSMTMLSDCINPPCPGFSDWSAWTVCSKTCGNGTKTRFRECLSPSSCNGTTNMSTVCNNTSCSEFSDWSAWTVCSKTCGNGTKTRFRECLNSLSCNGTMNMSSVCVNPPCQVHVGWANWSVWTSCDRSCGGGLKYSYRTCVNSEPGYNPAVCDGDAMRQEECNLQICPVDGKWSPWSQWSLCDKPCNNGVRKRKRFCDSPVPQYNGKDCIGGNEIAMSCNKHQCRSVSLNVTMRFTEEVFSNELLDRNSAAFNNLRQRILENITALYGSKNHVIKLDIIHFRPGSVKSSFTLTFKEISSTEVVILSSYIDEKKLLWKMPLEEYKIETNEVPPSPSRISAERESPTSFELHWESFSSLMNVYNITGFLIMYRKTVDFNETDWIRIATSPNQTSINITNLEPYVLYTVRVTAMVHDSLGLPSQFIDVNTNQGVPTKPPKNFTCQALSSSEIFCEWSDIPYQSVNGELISYKLYYRIYDLRKTPKSDHHTWNRVTMDGTHRSAVIQGLKPFTRYELEIHGTTNAGPGLGEWFQVRTDEDVPSSSPSNITAHSYISKKYIDISWNSIPKENWNGKPVAIVFSYVFLRRGRGSVDSEKTNKILLDTDRRHHRITGLQANWAIVFSIAGSTNAGEGVFSEVTTVETCLCSKNIYSAWYEKSPYVFLNASTKVVGIFPSILQEIVSSVCGSCASYGKTVLHFNQAPSGQDPRRTSKDDLTAKLSHDLQFHFPVSGGKEQMLYEGDYQYVNIIDHVSSVFVVIDKKKAPKTALVLNAVSQSFPILIVIVVLVILSGIVIWFVDQCKNPDELRRGNFFRGVSNGAWWAFITMTTVGYGDIAPRGFFGRIITVAWTIVGIIMTGVFISTLSTAITAVTLNKDVRLYGTKVAAVYNSSEYWLGVRRWAMMNSTGTTYSTTSEVLQALVSRKVTGVLLESNEASTLYKYFSDNSLRVAQEVMSSRGLGMVLSGEMVGLHTQIRAFVKENSDLIDKIVAKGTASGAKVEKEPYMSSTDTDQATGFFDKNSTEFRLALFYLLITLAVMVFLGCSYSFSGKLVKVLNRKIHPAVKPHEQRVIDAYNERCDELMKMVDNFVKDCEKHITDLDKQQGKERFALLLKHCETTPFGPPAWIKHKTISSQQIMTKLKKDEIMHDSLIRKPARKTTAKKARQMQGVIENDVEFLNLDIASDDDL